jgi:hypothetical protein
MSLLILAVDDEADVEELFRQYFRRDLRDGRFTMEFADSASCAAASRNSAGAYVVRRRGVPPSGYAQLRHRASD